MKIEFSGIKSRVHRNHTKIISSIQKVLHRGLLLKGVENEKLAKSLSKYLGGGYTTLTSGGHFALTIAIRSLGLKEKDEIILPANAYPTAFGVARAQKGTIRLVDVDLNGIIDIEKLKKIINRKTKILVIVHLYGFVCPIKEIEKICKKRGVKIIEDCAQAFGSFYNDRPAGSFGDISCFSFYPTKNLGTVGDGGAIWTEIKKYNLFFKKAVSYGENRKYESEFVSDHSRLSEIEAAVLNLFLTLIKKEEELKNNVFKTYLTLLKKTGLLEGKVRILNNGDSSNYNQHLFVLEIDKRNKLKKYLEGKGIPSLVHYPIPIHLTPSFSYLGYKKGDFPISERLSKNILSLPFHPFLKQKEIKYIVESIKSFYHA